MRESFIRYIASGEGTSVSGGATADSPLQLPGSSAALTYGFHFPCTEGWHDAGADPGNPGDDTAAIEFGGAVRFLYSAHEIDLSTAELEIEIAGARSRAIFAISESGGAPQRQVLVNLDLSRAARIDMSGGIYTYERVPGGDPGRYGQLGVRRLLRPRDGVRMLHVQLHRGLLIVVALAACSLATPGVETVRADGAQVTVIASGGEQQTLSLPALGAGDVIERTTPCARRRARAR